MRRLSYSLRLNPAPKGDRRRLLSEKGIEFEFNALYAFTVSSNFAMTFSTVTPSASAL
jgi:hypothetical protein